MQRIPSEFVAKMSHDLKTPVGNAMMYTELMADDIKSLSEEYPELDEKLKPLLQYCRNIHLSSSKLINAIQSWGYTFQIEDGVFEIRNHTIDLEKLMQKVIDANEIFIRGKSLNVHFNYLSKQNAYQSDSEFLALILDNLLLLFINMARSGDEIRIEVTDENHGITFRFFAPLSTFAEVLTKMFQSGQTITDHMVPQQGILKPGGYGLLFASLALDFMKARFGVDEKDVESRSFWFCLPLS